MKAVWRSQHKIKLLICNTSRNLRGGVENIVADLCRNLPRYDIDPLVALTKGMNFNDPERYRQAFSDLPTLDIDGTGGTRQARIEGLLKVLRYTRPDIVLIARVADAYEAMRYLKIRGEAPRLAVTVQAYEPHYIYDTRLYGGFLDLCVTSGNLIRKAIIQWSGLPSERVVSIPGGVRLPVEQMVPRQPKTPIRIGYVGRLDPNQKRIMDLVPFVRALAAAGISYTLDVVGSGPADEQLRTALHEEIEVGCVQFYGWQDQHTLYTEIYPKLDILVHFAHTEGITIAPREAMAHGVVPIVSEFIGLHAESQFIHETNALIFPVGDITKAVANVRRLFNESNLLTRLSANAMHSQTGSYTYDGAIAAWAEAFHTCLEQPPRLRGMNVPHFRPDGRLTRLGISPWFAQRLRNLFGMHYLHTDGGGEWPTGSGLMTSSEEQEIMRLVPELDKR